MGVSPIVLPKEVAMMPVRLVSVGPAVLLALSGSSGFADAKRTPVSGDAVKPGEFDVEPTTLINAGFEWYVDGDDNHNATVEVQYRQARGNGSWQKGMNLLRIQNEVAVNQPYYTY